MTINIKKYFNRYFENLVILFLSLTILPFLILSIFNNPPLGDDFMEAILVNEEGFWRSQYLMYTCCQGRYFSYAVLSSANPLIFKSILGYKMFPIILVIFFLISTYLFISEITSNSLSKKEIIICTLTFTSLYFYRMPSVAAFFWLTSAVTYELANILLLILFTLILKFFKEQNSNKKLILQFFIIILILAAVGSNEVSMVMLIELLFSIFILNFLIYKKANWKLFLFIFIAILGFCIVYFAPGTHSRFELSPGSQLLINSIINTVSFLPIFISNRILDTPLLLLTILFIPACVKISSKIINKNFILINPIYSIILLLVLLASCAFTSYWGSGIILDRTLNVIYFLFLIGWFINILIVINYLKNKFNFKFYPLPYYALIIISIAISLTFFKTNNIRTTYADLLHGTPYKYDEELKERYRIIYQSASDTCVVDSIKYIPRLLPFGDINRNLNNQYNRYYAKYFNKKAIVLKKSNLDSTK